MSQSGRSYILIDGSWLHHALKGIRKRAAQELVGKNKDLIQEAMKKDSLHELNLNWNKLLEYIHLLSTSSSELVKGYLFQAEKVQDWYSTKESKERTLVENLQKDYVQQLAHYQNLQKKNVKRLALGKVGYLKTLIIRDEEKNPIKATYKIEKGVDLGLAMRAVEILKEDTECRQIILMSGDGDYNPLISYVKQHFVWVEVPVVSFKSGVPPRARGSAESLGDTSGNRIDIYENSKGQGKGLRDFIV